MRKLLLRYGNGTQEAVILDETNTRFEIRRIKKKYPDEIYNPSWISKRDVRIMSGEGTMLCPECSGIGAKSIHPDGHMDSEFCAVICSKCVGDGQVQWKYVRPTI